MVAVFKTQLDSYSENDGVRIIPDAAHEVSATLLLTIDGRKVSIGNIRENFDNLANVMVRLGTKVSDGYPSSIGFRVLLRTDAPKSRDSGSIEDNYHLVSCKFDPQWGEVCYMLATKEDKRELVEALPFRKSLEKDLTAGTDHDLYRMDFIISDTNGFLISYHKPDLRTSNGQVKKTAKLLPFIAYATKTSLFFIADKLLIEHLDNAIKQNCIGVVPPSWKTALPDSAIPKWGPNVQTQMVAGSIDIYNVLLASLHEKSLRDGRGTAVSERPEATQFRDFIRKAYPNIRQESSNKVYPVNISQEPELSKVPLLNVSDGCFCVQLPFGASMLNRSNTYAAINALHGLLAAGIASDHIAIITLYPTQVAAYQDALNRCHKYNPVSGYNLVQVGLLEAWKDKTIGVAIVDLVRTSNASGNLGYPSQVIRLKVLLTLHRNGLIVVGDRGCTVNSQGSVTSAKLDKVLQWFADNGRIVRMSSIGLPQPLEYQPSNNFPSTDPRHPIIRQRVPSSSPVSTTNASLSSTSSNASHGHTSSVSSASTVRTARKYVGIPGLEHMSIDEPANEDARVPLDKENEAKSLAATRISFVRQGFVNSRGASFRPEAKPLASSTDAGFVHASNLHQPVPKSQGMNHHGKLEAGRTRDTGASLGEIITPGKETRSQKTDDLTMEAPTCKIYESESSSIKEVTSKGTTPFSLSSAKPKIQDLTSSSTVIPNTDIDARFEAVTSRFKMEYGSEVFHKVLTESRSKLPKLTNRRLSGMPLASSSDFGNAISSVGMPLESASTKIEKPLMTTKETSPQRFRFKSEAVSPIRKPTVDMPSHETTVKHPSNRPTRAALEENRIIKDASTMQSLTSRFAEKASNGLTDRNEAASPRQIGSDPSVSKSALGQGTGQNLNFATSYQKKYRAIGSLFANMADMPRDQSGEDQLFRRLAEAFMDENVEAFEDICTQLLGMAAGLKTRGLRRT